MIIPRHIPQHRHRPAILRSRPLRIDQFDELILVFHPRACPGAQGNGVQQFARVADAEQEWARREPYDEVMVIHMESDPTRSSQDHPVRSVGPRNGDDIHRDHGVPRLVLQQSLQVGPCHGHPACVDRSVHQWRVDVGVHPTDPEHVSVQKESIDTGGCRAAHRLARLEVQELNPYSRFPAVASTEHGVRSEPRGADQPELPRAIPGSAVGPQRTPVPVEAHDGIGKGVDDEKRTVRPQEHLHRPSDVQIVGLLQNNAVEEDQVGTQGLCPQPGLSGASVRGHRNDRQRGCSRDCGAHR